MTKGKKLPDFERYHIWRPQFLLYIWNLSLQEPCYVFRTKRWFQAVLTNPSETLCEKRWKEYYKQPKSFFLLDDFFFVRSDNLNWILTFKHSSCENPCLSWTNIFKLVIFIFNFLSLFPTIYLVLKEQLKLAAWKISIERQDWLSSGEGRAFWHELKVQQIYLNCQL